jgi:hypothetical protein
MECCRTWYVPLKCLLTFTRLHRIICQKKELFITTAVRISNPSHFILSNRTKLNTTQHYNGCLQLRILMFLLNPSKQMCGWKLKTEIVIFSVMTSHILVGSHWRWRQQVPPECWHPPTRLHSYYNPEDHNLHCYSSSDLTSHLKYPTNNSIPRSECFRDCTVT